MKQPLMATNQLREQVERESLLRKLRWLIAECEKHQNEYDDFIGYKRNCVNASQRTAKENSA